MNSPVIGAIAVYDGRRYLGEITKRGLTFVAVDSEGQQLGKFEKVEMARNAVLRKHAEAT